MPADKAVKPLRLPAYYNTVAVRRMCNTSAKRRLLGVEQARVWRIVRNVPCALDRVVGVMVVLQLLRIRRRAVEAITRTVQVEAEEQGVIYRDATTPDPGRANSP
jgi:hypothetical protein